MMKTFYDNHGNMATIKEVELSSGGMNKNTLYELSKYDAKNDNYLYFRSVYGSFESAMNNLNVLCGDTWKEQ